MHDIQGQHSWTPREASVSPIGRFGQLISWAWFRATGWRIVGARPKLDKYVLIAAPHTSWWDVVYMLTAAALFGTPLSWLVKHDAARPPLGWLVRFLGGIPKDRSSPQGLVEQIVEVFRERDRLVLAVPPEGTRARAEFWKSGFYRVAKAAGVPIVCSILDYGTKTAEMGPTIWPSDDVHADMDRIRQVYAGKLGRHPENMGPIRLEMEAEDSP